MGKGVARKRAAEAAAENSVGYEARKDSMVPSQRRGPHRLRRCLLVLPLVLSVMSKSLALVVTCLAIGASLPLRAAVHLASPFGDHMVLQEGQPVPVWGAAAAGEKVTVKFAGQQKSAAADAGGHWRVDLAPLATSAKPRAFTVTGSATPTPLTLTDVLVGEVWLCGGQSNMERQLGLRIGQKPILNWEAEVASANHPLIRQCYVTQTRDVVPHATVQASWTVCSPETVADFTAVGYFFARDLQAVHGGPVGIIHSSWGGTPAEAWTSREGLAAFHEFDDTIAALRDTPSDPTKALRMYHEKLAVWYRDNDPGSGAHPWSVPDLDTTGWETMNLPTLWEAAGHPDYDGVAWFRRSFDLPAGWAGHDLELHLAAVDDSDTTWVNGVEVGSNDEWNFPRVYRVPAAILKPTGNTIAVRVLDTGGGGGIWNGDHDLPLELRSIGVKGAPLSLRGPWLCRFSRSLDGAPTVPPNPALGALMPTVLYNGMIAPLIPYAIRGVVFYQGENNAGRPTQYRTLLPALIEDWRKRWDEGDFPFLFVQIAPFREQPPEIREAQLIAWQHTPNTAMAVTIDCGDPEDIHPADKQPVGARLALAARALAYGEKIEYSGPVFADMKVAGGGRAVLHFTHLGGGLLAPGGTLEGFTVAGADGVFHPAKAVIAGDTVEVSADEVPKPTAVRYGWANVAKGNLFNRAGLPASPFRTDVD